MEPEEGGEVEVEEIEAGEVEEGEEVWAEGEVVEGEEGEVLGEAEEVEAGEDLEVGGDLEAGEGVGEDLGVNPLRLFNPKDLTLKTVLYFDFSLRQFDYCLKALEKIHQFCEHVCKVHVVDL